METIIIELIGYAGGTLTLSTMIPQIIKSYKTKKVEDVSLLMVILVALGTLLWTIYGYLISNMPVFIMDGIGFVMAIIQIVLMLNYRK
jgi:MtN3 and saliva related transmembrane protein